MTEGEREREEKKQSNLTGGFVRSHIPDNEERCFYTLQGRIQDFSNRGRAKIRITSAKREVPYGQGPSRARLVRALKSLGF